MTSHHDLKEQLYTQVHAKPFTRIYGVPDWQQKELLKEQAHDTAMEEHVGYNWSGGMGLLMLVIGATRYAAENPTLSAFVEPMQPPSGM